MVPFHAVCHPNFVVATSASVLCNCENFSVTNNNSRYTGIVPGVGSLSTCSWAVAAAGGCYQCPGTVAVNLYTVKVKLSLLTSFVVSVADFQYDTTQ